MSKTLYYKDFCTSEDHGYNLARAMQACRREGANCLVLSPGVYDIYPDCCEERVLYISNHGQNGPKRIAAVIEDMQDFTLDLGGATLRVHGDMTHLALLRSSRITVKNGILQNPATQFMQARVAAHGEDYVDLTPEFGEEQFSLYSGLLVIRHPYSGTLLPVSTNIEFNGENGEMEPGTSDHTMGLWWNFRTERLENKNFRVHGVTRKPPIGNVLIINAARRFGAGIFCEDCRDVRVENVTVNSCLGMGFIAQTSENIHLDGFSTRREGGRLYTANADATHFVNCTGKVIVENGVFEGQLDDALNIHGMYTRVIRRSGRELFVKEMHSEAKGIRMLRAGDRIRALDPDSLIPYTCKTVEEVEYLNQDTVRLLLAEDAEDIAVGDDIENISRAATLVFRNNTVRNNRARGMLLASTAPMLVENCYFHTGGCSIKFESDGAYWFESGGTTDVTIRACHFDRCKHADKWGDAVIDMAPRRKVEENAYFHGRVRVVENTFDMLVEKAVNFNNVTEAIFEGNTVTQADGIPTAVELSHVKEARVQDGIRIMQK